MVQENLGTCRYAAPEILLNLEPDCSADIFSFAIMMWQLKENKIPYEKIHANEIVIWNVVKNDIRPDSRKIARWSDEANISNRSSNLLEETSQGCKSECSYLRAAKFITLTPKSINRNSLKIPEILINRYGSHQSNRIYNSNKRLLRKKLFESKLSPKIKGDDKGSRDDIQNLFIDRLTRSAESVWKVEMEYVNLYRKCWSRDKSCRYVAKEVYNILQKLIESL